MSSDVHRGQSMGHHIWKGIGNVKEDDCDDFAAIPCHLDTVGEVAERVSCGPTWEFSKVMSREETMMNG